MQWGAICEMTFPGIELDSCRKTLPHKHPCLMACTGPRTPVDNSTRHTIREVLVNLDGRAGLLLEGLDGLAGFADNEPYEAVVQRRHFLGHGCNAQIV